MPGLVHSLFVFFAKNLSLIRGFRPRKSRFFQDFHEKSRKIMKNRLFSRSGGRGSGPPSGAPAAGKDTHTGTLGSGIWVVLQPSESIDFYIYINEYELSFFGYRTSQLPEPRVPVWVSLPAAGAKKRPKIVDFRQKSSKIGFLALQAENPKKVKK